MVLLKRPSNSQLSPQTCRTTKPGRLACRRLRWVQPWRVGAGERSVKLPTRPGHRSPARHASHRRPGKPGGARGMPGPDPGRRGNHDKAPRTRLKPPEVGAKHGRWLVSPARDRHPGDVIRLIIADGQRRHPGHLCRRKRRCRDRRCAFHRAEPDAGPARAGALRRAAVPAMVVTLRSRRFRLLCLAVGAIVASAVLDLRR